MPKSITFFSRGKTPIYVNYVIAHNNFFLIKQMDILMQYLAGVGIFLFLVLLEGTLEFPLLESAEN